MGLRGRIVYAVGFGNTEAAITWQVAELSKAWQTAVVLVAVAPPHWLPLVAAERRHAAKARLLDVARRLRALRGHVGGLKAVIGEPCTEVRRIADQIGAELIIAGAGPARRGGGVSQVALELARRARQDVWICRPEADPHVDHVLCAADTSPLAGDALRRSVDLCRRFNARLRVLSVLDEPSGQDPDDTARACREQQRRFLECFDLRGVPLSRGIAWGLQTPVELLLEAERFPDGLLVMGAASAAGARGLGATAEPVLRACPSSVLIVRRRRAAEPGEDGGTTLAITEDADGGRDPTAPTSPPSR